ncbi:reticulon-4 receptor-like [Branchiostoma lanceolatum]|uniref:reticulon-4 receptor-like n=1 Tax=Branchiostoma lanceolatum TaxID=7740 RepID=UPI0034511275
MASLTVPVRLSAVAVMLALVLCGTLPEGSRAQCPSMCTCADGTVSCVGQNLKEIPKDIPADTTTLLLHDNAITEAADLQFLSLKSLKVLNISKNQLYMVESLAYEGLPGLESLDLSDNAIMQFDLNRSPALQLPFLTELRLNENKITSIPDNAFTGLPKMQKLDLSRNGIFALSDVAFSTDHALTSLDLSGNYMIALFPDLFVQLPNLRELRLHDNHIFTLAPGAFRGLENLKSLTLAGNKLSVPVAEPFRNLTGLLDVTLANNSWVCEAVCELLPVQALISARSIYKQQFLCASGEPESLKGQYVEDIRVPKDDLGCLEPEMFPGMSGRSGSRAISATTLVAALAFLCYNLLM